MKAEKLANRNHVVVVPKSAHLPVFKEGNTCGLLLTLLMAFTEGILSFALQMRKLSQRD